MMSLTRQRDRRSIRHQVYDYAQGGAYFVTICAFDRQCVFGEMVDGEMRLSVLGQIVEEAWCAFPHHFPNVELDEFVVMPDHGHGIIVIVEPSMSGVGARHAVPLRPTEDSAIPRQPNTERFNKPVPGSLPTIVRSFKSAATRRANHHRRTPGKPLWQRNYYGHVVRGEDDLSRIRHHIVNSPAACLEDDYHPSRL